MTAPMTKDKSDITEEDILAWLRENPDFLSRNPDACEFLLPPTEFKDRKVADFQQFMVKRLREDRAGILGEAQEIVETSRINMNNQARIFRCVLMLLEAKTFEDFIHTITMDMTSILDVDIITLAVESEGDVIPHINIPGVRAVPAGSVDSVMKDAFVRMDADIEGHEAIYGGGAGLVKSQLILRLNYSSEAPTALVAFGSREVGHFAEGQATDLVAFLGHVIERCLRIWLAV